MQTNSKQLNISNPAPAIRDARRTLGLDMSAVCKLTATVDFGYCGGISTQEHRFTNGLKQSDRHNLKI